MKTGERLRMSENVRRMVASVILLAFFSVWVYVAVLPWRVAVVTAAVENLKAGAVAVFRLPWAGNAARFEARRLMRGERTDAWLADKLLRYSIGARLLYAPAWLDRAELALRAGDIETADRYAEIAQALWPRRERLLWRLAMFSLRRGNDARALQFLKRYLAVRINAVARAAVIATRLESDPRALIVSLLPEQDPPGRESGYYRVQLLGFAIRSRNVELATEVWSRLPAEARQRSKVAFGYVEFLVASNRPDLAVSAWRDYTGQKAIPGVYNPGFERELVQGGFGWRAREVKGVRWERDGKVKYGGSYSLHVEFDGTENVNYRHIFQTLVLEPGWRYRLSGYWRGAGLSTRSGPYLEVYSRGGAFNVNVQTLKKRGSWVWEPFQLDFSMPKDASFADFRIRRGSTRALDRLIEGHLWLDELTLEVLPRIKANGET